MSFKKAIYWFSIIGPIVDVLCGAFNGIAELIGKYSDNRRYMDELNKFNSDNLKNTGFVDYNSEEVL